MSSSLEAKIVVLGSQGVGKTSLVWRFCKSQFNPAEIQSTVGASFMTKRVVDSDADTVVRLQIWDTAGQERFRSISRLYYRGANACILCYSITDAQSFVEMGVWLTEIRRNLPSDIVLHVVGTKADMVTRDPSKREVPFERCIAYVAENLAPGMASTPPPTAMGLTSSGVAYFGGPGGLSATSATITGAAVATAGAPGTTATSSGGIGAQHNNNSNNDNNNTLGAAAAVSQAQLQSTEPRSPSSKRSSGFWGMEVGWDACHEISAETGEGVEEVFRVVTRKLVEQNRRISQAMHAATATPGTPFSFADGTGSGGYLGADCPGSSGGGNSYFDAANARGSFRVGRDRRSWLFSPNFSPAVTIDQATDLNDMGADERAMAGKRKCC